jgi:hypothetical protein
MAIDERGVEEARVVVKSKLGPEMEQFEWKMKIFSDILNAE